MAPPLLLQVVDLADDALEGAARTAGEGSAVRVLDVADQTGDLAAAGVFPRIDPERVEIRA